MNPEMSPERMKEIRELAHEFLRRWYAIPPTKPTIEQLEKILSEPDPRPIEIAADGSVGIGVREKEAELLIAFQAEVERLRAAPLPSICDGCNVRDCWEHRCHGSMSRVRDEATGKHCECPDCCETCREKLMHGRETVAHTCTSAAHLLAIENRAANRDFPFRRAAPSLPAPLGQDGKLEGEK